MSAETSPHGRTWRAGLVAALRRPWLIATELLAIALASTLTAALPQVPDEEAVAAFIQGRGALGQVTGALGLHDVTHSAWFLALLALALSSLLAVQWEQWRRLRRQWGEPVRLASFGRTAWRAEAAAATLPRVPEAPLLRSRGRIGQLGSPLFHLGLVTLVLAGGWRALSSADASVRLLEGASIAPEPGAYDLQRGGALAGPFALEAPVRLDEVEVGWYPSGVLRQLSAKLTLEPPAEGTHQLAINAPLDLDGGRLYLTQTWGVAALLEVGSPGRTVQRLAYLEIGEDFARGSLALDGGLELRLKAPIRRGRPEHVEVRLARQRVLLGLADLRPGEGVQLEDGAVATLVGLPRWIQLRGSRDPSRPLFFFGLGLALVGAVLMMAIVRVDTAVVVQDGRLVVALRAARFAPLFQEQFEALRKEWIP